jgi:hypothetical protein
MGRLVTRTMDIRPFPWRPQSRGRSGLPVTRPCHRGSERPRSSDEETCRSCYGDGPYPFRHRPSIAQFANPGNYLRLEM